MLEFISDHSFLLAGVLIAGFAAGFAGGLFGIGGGIITVPVLYAVFHSAGIGEDQSLKTAIGTSLGVIIVTSIRSLMTHHSAGHVDMDILKSWAPWIALGAGAGGFAAKWAPAEVLTIIFAGGAFFIAWRRLRGRKEGAHHHHHHLHRRSVKIPVGLGTGVFSSLMGLGGGAVGVLVMTASGRAIHQAVATSAGFGVAVALPGVVGFIWSGLGTPGLPPGSLGFFNFVAFVSMALMAGVSAPLGAKFAHRTDGALLSRMFGVYVLIAAIGLVVDIFSG
jgi:uncharacterized membrane protein YfcA